MIVDVDVDFDVVVDVDGDLDLDPNLTTPSRTHSFLPGAASARRHNPIEP
jgi:hypothetical protein